MDPKYSVLFCNQSYEKYKDAICQWLSEGIKIIWFTKREDERRELVEAYKNYKKALLLQVYVVTVDDELVIVDGKDSTRFVERKLEAACPLFNSAQYLVEHCNSSEHIVVQASAGTGKTTVMIDRIMYLLHTEPNLHLSDVYMITFTNDATNQMNKRLQDALMIRYKLTKQKRYLRWVEEQSQMHISTIHSFALEMLKEYGISESFTKNLAIKSLQYEKKELIKDLIDERINERETIKDQLGVPFYRANALVNDFWSGFSKIGISHDDIEHLNWGIASDESSEPFQKIIKNIIEPLDKGYFDIKRKNEAIALDDIMRDLQLVLVDSELPVTDVSMKYLFIDEFQDSDLSQIRVACLFAKLLNTVLFVVGDVKQSIYRFRGATDQSFNILKQYMDEIGIKPAIQYKLVNNYRTSAEVLARMDAYFRCWGKMGQLSYDKPVIPFNNSKGKIKMIHIEANDSIEDHIASKANEELDILERKIKNNEIQLNEKARVVFLTRTNTELNLLASIFRKNKIPASIVRDGSFYASEAVRDFYIMISSFLFCDEPKYIFNYLLTPYAGNISSMNLNDMEWLHGDYENLISYLNRYLDETEWKEYHKQLRLKPVLSVIKDMLDNIPVINNFIMSSKIRKIDEGWEEKRCLAATLTEARQYQANLDKLIEILQRNFGGDKVSLYDIYIFLKLNIASDRNENEAPVESTDDYSSVLCMTVHKAKGLEYETIIIPYMGRKYPIFKKTEILINPENKNVGWYYTGDKEKKNKRWTYSPMQNNLYNELKEQDNVNTIREETRILYVAMTRAINTLICLVPEAKNETCWAHLIEEVGVDYE